MSTEKLQKLTGTLERSTGVQFSRYTDVLAGIAVIAALQILAFGIHYRSIGFYLDDWSMLCLQFFGPQNWFKLPATYFFDPRVAIRPIEALYFPWLYLAFGLKPFPWHMFVGCLEVSGATFLFLSLRRVLQDTFLALCGAAIFLLYPCHDATHYWITCSSGTFSITLYLLSLWLGIKAAQSGNKKCYAGSVISFALAVFNYESVMPLFAVMFLVCICILQNFPHFLEISGASTVFSLGYAAVVYSMYLYERTLLRIWHVGALRPVSFDFGNMIKVYTEGINRILAPHALTFYLQEGAIGLASFHTVPRIALVGLICLSVISGAIFLLSRDKDRLLVSNKSGYVMALAIPGIIALLASYSIFGIAVEYHPTLSTPWSRINYGGAVGATLLLLWVLAEIRAAFFHLSRKRIVAETITLGLVLSIITMFAAADWGYARPWMESKEVQSLVQHELRDYRKQIPRGGNLILVGCPRYNMWAPVFDGVWDFQPMAKMILRDNGLNATVASNRMTFADGVVKDISMNYLCGAYSPHGLRVLVPFRKELYKVNSSSELLSLVERFGERSQIDPKSFPRWRQEVGEVQTNGSGELISSPALVTPQEADMSVTETIPHPKNSNALVLVAIILLFIALCCLALYTPFTPLRGIRSTLLVALSPLLVLVIAECVVFGLHYQQIGFYLDDWSMLCTQYFGPKDWLKLPLIYFADPRMAIRPLEPFFFSWFYLCFGMNPVSWQVFGGICEIISSLFLYLILNKILRKPAIALAGAVLFLTYPCHDATHYWVLCTSWIISAMLYLCSLWLVIKAVYDEKPMLFFWSLPCFALAVFNHEFVLPLGLINIWYMFFPILFRRKKISVATMSTCACALGYLGIAGAMMCYVRTILPLLHLGATRPVGFDPLRIWQVTCMGVDRVLGPRAFVFFSEQAASGLQLFHWPDLFILCGIIFAACFIGGYTTVKQNVSLNEFVEVSLPSCFWNLFVPGVAMMIVSYLIFGMAEEYQPKLTTPLNRINYGGAIGATFIIASILYFASTLLHNRLVKNAQTTSHSSIYQQLTAACLLPVIVFFVMADWGYAKPWIDSWSIQQQVQKELIEHRNEIPRGGNLFLIGCPRYAMWAPVFDGMWDFEGMAEIILNDNKLKANVASNRLAFQNGYIKDISMNYVCGVYPIANLRVLLPFRNELRVIHNAGEFIDLVSKYGVASQIDPDTIPRWRKEAGIQIQ